MGNKIIKITNNTTNKPSNDELVVYKDISMNSTRKITSSFDEDEDNKIQLSNKQQYWISKEINVKAVFNSLINIFSWIQGERILNPEFGSKLNYYLYEGITEQNKEMISAEIRGLCLRWEPRVQIVEVKPINNVNDTENNTVMLDIIFTIPSLSSKQYKYSYTYNRAK